MKFFYALIICTLIFSACKKEEVIEEITPTLEATINGNLVTMDNQLEATMVIDTFDASSSMGLSYGIVLKGSNLESGTSDMRLKLNSRSPLKSVEYEQTGQCQDVFECVSFEYSKPFPAGIISFLDDADFKLNLTTLEFVSGGKVIGTFSGNAINILTREISKIENGKLSLTFE